MAILDDLIALGPDDWDPMPDRLLVLDIGVHSSGMRLGEVVSSGPVLESDTKLPKGWYLKYSASAGETVSIGGVAHVWLEVDHVWASARLPSS